MGHFLKRIKVDTERLEKIFLAILILLPVFFTFKKIFFLEPLLGGDAPHFFPEELGQLVSTPSAWTLRDSSFGGVNQFLYIWPLMFLYGFLGHNLSLGNEIAVRVVFFLPAVFFSIVNPVIFTKYLGLSKRVQFVSSFLYSLNTYFILLIDGGQIGVALAYSLFPLTLTFLKKYFDSASYKTFFWGSLFLFLNTTADPRISIIALFVIILWVALKNPRRLLLSLP